MLFASLLSWISIWSAAYPPTTANSIREKEDSKKSAGPTVNPCAPACLNITAKLTSCVECIANHPEISHTFENSTWPVSPIGKHTPANPKQRNEFTKASAGLAQFCHFCKENFFENIALDKCLRKCHKPIKPSLPPATTKTSVITAEIASKSTKTPTEPTIVENTDDVDSRKDKIQHGESPDDSHSQFVESINHTIKEERSNKRLLMMAVPAIMFFVLLLAVIVLLLQKQRIERVRRRMRVLQSVQHQQRYTAFRI